MKKSKSYRLNVLTIMQLEQLQEEYHLNHTELIEKAVDLLDALSVSYYLDSDSIVKLPDTQKKLLCKPLKF